MLTTKYYLQYCNVEDDDYTLVCSEDLGRLIQFMQEHGVETEFILTDSADYTDFEASEFSEVEIS